MGCITAHQEAMTPEPRDRLLLQTSTAAVYIRTNTIYGNRWWSSNLFERGEDGELCFKSSKMTWSEADAEAWGRQQIKQ